jgi:hypothetical protein
MLTRLIQILLNGFAGLGQLATNLPLSPFQDLGSFIPDNPVSNFVSWIIPVEEMLSLMSIWLIAIGIYYLIKVPLRWAKVLGG